MSEGTFGAVVLVYDKYRQYLDQCLASLGVAYTLIVNGTESPDTWWGYAPAAVIPTATTVGNARNLGVSLTHTDYITHVDSDDWVVPGYLAQMAAALDAHPEVDLVHTDMTEHVAETGEERLLRVPQTRHTGACMYRRAVWELLRGYRVTGARQEDTEFFDRFHAAGMRSLHLPLSGYVYRTHVGQNSETRYSAL